MLNNNLLHTLKERGLIELITDEKKLNQLILEKPIFLYCGFDPTADSLHIGHLIPLICLKYFQLSGHHIIIIIGGATSIIGDPSFKNTNRELSNINNIPAWIQNIKKQIKIILNFNCNNKPIILNNCNWFNKICLLDFLKNIGKYFFINKMIHKEAIKKRINQNNIGISFTEFSYNLLQSYDFAYLHNKYNVKLQIGGSDQWGNIISGIDLIKNLYKKNVFGLTTPLITNKNGIKFGKTEKNTIWLDSNKTSPYKFYQFWINIDDSEIYRFLKLFTLLDIEHINKLKTYIYKNNKFLMYKNLLAEEVTYMVHGKKGLAIAKRITDSLFKNSINNLKEKDFIQLIKDKIPNIIMKYNNINLKQTLLNINLVSSLKQAHNIIISGAIKLNGIKITSPKYLFKETDKLYNHYSLICYGKKKYYLLYWKS